MGWPTGQDYNEAVQNPSSAFADPDLIFGQPTLDALGLPRPITGAFAYVYKFRCGARTWAIRCFQREFKDQQARYVAIGDYLRQYRLPYTVDFDFLDKGICVRGQWYPILKMEWVQGEPLNDYIRSHLSDSTALTGLAERWVRMIAALAQAGIAHGDLQHGNIVIVNGDFKLLDYDGMYVPTMGGRFAESHELGHRNYQHPRRSANDFSASLDSFSAWVIYLALVALSKEPAFWQLAQAGDESLLFRKEDFESPQTSATFGRLQRHKDGQLVGLTKLVVALLAQEAAALPSLAGQPLVGPVINTSASNWLQDHIGPHAIGNGPGRPSQTNGSAPPSESPSSSKIFGRSGSGPIVQAAIPCGSPPAQALSSGGRIEVGNSNWVLDFLAPPGPNHRFDEPKRWLQLLAVVSVAAITILLRLMVQIPGNLATHVAIAACPTFLFNGMAAFLAYRSEAFAVDLKYVRTRFARERSAMKGVERHIQAEIAKRHIFEKENNQAEKESLNKQEGLGRQKKNAIKGLEQQLTKALEPTERSLVAHLAAERRDIDSLQQAFQGSLQQIALELKRDAQMQANQIQHRLELMRQQSIQSYIQAHDLLTANLYGVPLHLVYLMYHHLNYRTAADLSYGRVLSVHGIGDVRAGRLMAWAQQTISQAERQAPTRLMQADLDAIEAPINAHRIELESKQKKEKERHALEESGVKARYQALRQPLEQVKQAEVLAMADKVQAVDRDFAARLAEVDNSLVAARKNLAPYFDEIEARLQGLRKELFEATWHAGRTQREVETFRFINFRRFTVRSYINR